MTNNTDVCHIDDIWSLNISDLNGYGPESERGFRYILIVIDKFTEYG